MRSQKHLFSLPPGLHYLNCAYMSPLSKRVEEAGLAGVRRKRDPSTIESHDFFVQCDRVRSRFARLVNADDLRRIAIVPSASYGLAAAARNAPIERGRNIVLAADQFPSNVYIWRRLADERGAEIRTVPAPDATRRGQAWNEAMLAAIDRDTAIVALGQVHWTDGTLFDLAAIGERAREVGARLIIDGTQSVGAMPFDVQALRPDALVCAAYKWLTGPYAIGLAWYGELYDDGVPLEETWIAREGSEDFRALVLYRDEYRPGAARYDVGESSNFILIPMLDQALAQVMDWGVDAIGDHCRGLLRRVEAEARERSWGVEPAEDRAAHILGVRLTPDVDPERLQQALARRNVAVSLRGSAVRISPHLYNDETDIAELIAGMREVAGG